MNATGASPLRAVRLWCVLLAAWGLWTGRAADSPGRSCGFIGVENFSSFSRTLTSTGTVVLLSPVITTEFEWDELVVSWNARLAPATSLRVEARACHPDRATRFYVMGVWSPGAEAPARRSVTGQRDDDGDVQTDILGLVLPANRVQVRLTFEGLAGPAGNLPTDCGLKAVTQSPHSKRWRDGRASPDHAKRLEGERLQRRGDEPSELTFLGLSFLNTRTLASGVAALKVEPADPLPVPQRSQLAYEDGAAWCSPTAVSMVLSYWAERCGRPEWDRAVPDVAAGVFDPEWPGTGNWPFNTAYAGTLPAMRGYVTRLADLAELGAWLRSGVPVAASVSYSVLQGQPHTGNGHLVVCVGLTDTGDVVVNDPGTRHEVRRTFPQADFLRAWAHSHQTVYVIHPRDWPAPKPSAPPR